jgi:hypothetical protein
MSPSEFDLRAALHEGEGDPIDIGQLIAGAEARRAQRRVRIQSAAAVAAIVAVVGFGGSLLWRSGGGHNSASSGQTQLSRPALHSEPANGSARGPAAAASAAGCPDTFPRYELPGGGSPGQFGSTGPLFDKPVSSVLVCSYGVAAPRASSAGAPNAVRLTGANASELVNSLEHASTILKRANCPLLENTGQADVAMIGFTADGRKVATVTATLTVPPCNVEVSNGTAIRYDWQPPTAVLHAIGAQVLPAGGAVTRTNPLPGGRVHGSPINS